MFVSGAVIGIYFLTYFAHDLGPGLLIEGDAVIVAAVAFLLAVISYLWTPTRFLIPGSLSVYALLAGTAACLIVTSNGLESPFIALWILIAVFAGIFGVYGLLPMFAAGGYYLIVQSINSSLEQNTIVVTVIAGWLPLVASFIIWHSRRRHEDSKDRAYRDLASELNQVANKSEVVINAIADGVMALDHQGVIQLINPAAQQIIGWGKQDAVNLSYKSVLKLVDSKDQDLTEATDPIQQVLSTNKSISTEDLNLLTHSGKKLMVSIVVSPVGQLGAGVIVVFRDITKEKAEEREQAEFISTASHEMRTPVASIEGYLGLALNPATATIDEKARDFIMKAHASAQHLGRLFQDLLDVSKAEDGRLSNNPKVVDVVQFAHDIVEGLRPQADAKQLRLLFKPMPDDASTQGDRHLSPVFYANVDNDHLREVIANLTENAIKYTLKGDVVIDITGDSEHLTVSIADSGIGIPTEDIPHLFQKFYRVDNSDTREIGGTGLGLYLCRRLVEVMDGRLWVESQYKKGSTFFVELPRLSHEDATRLIEQAAASEQQVVETPPIIMEHPVVASPTPAAAAPAASTPIIAAVEQSATPVAPLATPAPAVQPRPAAPVVIAPAPPAPVPVATQPAASPVASVNPTAAAAPAARTSVAIPVRSGAENKP